MNGVNVEYEASLTQTAKGVWYCDKLRCGDETLPGLGAKLHLFMTEVEEQLQRHNFPETQEIKDKWKKAADHFKTGVKSTDTPGKKEK